MLPPSTPLGSFPPRPILPVGPCPTLIKMVHPPYGSQDDLDDTGLTQLADDYLLRDSMEESWHPLLPAVDGQYRVDQAANASMSQPYNSELASDLASASGNQYYTDGQLANSSSGYRTVSYPRGSSLLAQTSIRLVMNHEPRLMGIDSCSARLRMTLKTQVFIRAPRPSIPV